MTVVQCEDVALGVEQAGSGPALVLVHGSWSDRNTWSPVFDALSLRFRVIRYDRRGYGESQRPCAAPSVHVEDLLKLLRTLDLRKAILVGNSLGAIIAIRAALASSEHTQLVIAHEPPLLGLMRLESEHHPMATRVHSALARTLEAVSSGDHRLAAEIYVEGMASYPSAWQYLPEDIKQGFIDNASAFLADAGTFDQDELLPQDLERLGHRVVVTCGNRTSPYLKLIMNRLYATLPELRRHVFDFGGHVPHQTCPDEFVATTLRFATAIHGCGGND